MPVQSATETTELLDGVSGDPVVHVDPSTIDPEFRASLKLTLRAYGATDDESTTSSAVFLRATQESSGVGVTIAVWASLCMNLLLFGLKIWICQASGSLALMASVVDSFLDLMSQAVIAYTDGQQRRPDKVKYPAGRSRLQPIGIVICATFMGVGSVQVIARSGMALYAGAEATMASLSVSMFTLATLSAVVLAKLVLFIYCQSIAFRSSAVAALAVDHRNDVFSNIVAAVTAVTASRYPVVWFLDPAGAIAISIYIVWVWFGIASEQVNMLVGRVAPPEFSKKVKAIAERHHTMLSMDCLRAYHFGERYLVELEVILPEDMSVKDSHGIALALQQKIEQLEEVERAFVHVDYRQRDEDEHDWQTLKIATQ